MTTPSCTYCGNVASTADHCPPKLLFPRPRPFNLQTVPACLKCNLVSSKDEEYFRTLLMFTECATTPVGKQLRNDKHGRALERGKLAQRLARSIGWVEVHSEAGVYLGRQFTITPEVERVELVAVKIARGLYLTEFGAALPYDIGTFARFMIMQRVYAAVATVMPSLVSGSFRWPGVFDYRFGRVPGKPEMSMWVMRLYETAFFMVATAPMATLSEWQAKGALRPNRIYIPSGLAAATDGHPTG